MLNLDSRSEASGVMVHAPVSESPEPIQLPARPLAPAELHKLLSTNQLKLPELRRALPKAVFALEEWRGWLAVLFSFALIAVGETALFALQLGEGAALLWQLPALFAAWLVVATGMVRLFIIGHDCGHRAFSKTKWVNDVVGHICMASICSSYNGWRLSHVFHHSNTLVRDVDVDWAERMITRAEYQQASWRKRLTTRAFFGSPVGLMLGFIVGLFRRTFTGFYPQVSLSEQGRRDLLVSLIALLVTSGGVLVGLGLWGGAAAMFKHYLVPIELGMIAGAAVTYFHHNGEDAVIYDRDAWNPLLGQVVSTFDLRYPEWMEWLFLNTNYHRVHHIAPHVPYYHMKQATAALAHAFPCLHQERRFSFGYVVRAFQRPFIEPLVPGVYTQTGLHRAETSSARALTSD